jgi:tetratricopeptide (TPR) repeat protein
MNILALGNIVFVRELRALGHRVVTAGVEQEKDLIFDLQDFSFAEILRRIPAADRPDVCIISEHLGPRVFPSDLGHAPLPVAFYSIDTHLNYFWVKELARTVDCILTTQKDFIPDLARRSPQAHWLPWSFDPAESFDAGVERDLDIVFVGRVDENRLRRKNLLDHLAGRFNVSLFTPTPEKTYTLPEISRIFSRAKIVVNEAICQELNFRVFETLPTGALLLTEQIGNGLNDIFTDGEHLLTFTPYDFLDKAAWALEHDAERRAIADAGRQEALARHTRQARATELAQILEHCRIRDDRREPGRAYFLMLRRGVMGGERDVAMTEATLTDACRNRPRDGEAWLDLAEYHAACELKADAMKYYAESWRCGNPSARLAIQWGVLLAELGKTNEAVTVLKVLHTFPSSRRALALLEPALAGPIPSPALDMALAACLEETDDSFVPGFFPLRMGALLLNSIEYLQRACHAAPSAALFEMTGDIRLASGDPVNALLDYQGALDLDPTALVVATKLAMALAQSYCPAEAYAVAEAAWKGGRIPDALALMQALEPICTGGFRGEV